MAFVHGKKAYFAIQISTGGTLTAIDEYLNDVSLSRSFETAETTTFGLDDKTYLVGLGDATISLSGFFDSTLDAAIASHLGATTTATTFEFRASEASVGATNPKFTGSAFITSYDISPAIGDTVPVSIELQVTGPVTRATS
jgi:hypothetical protein